MAPLVLEGDTLGQKHQHYNKLVEEAVLNKPRIEPTLSEEDDIQNLLKIDVACKTRNVEFLIEVLKSEDLLYVSRAIKNCKWLITDKQYSHIVNPEYLHTQLSPEMTTKAFNKLMLSIRLNLKDEDRVEAFFKYTAERNWIASLKWLQHCSVTFILNELKQHGNEVPDSILRRLVEKSLSIFDVSMKNPTYSRYQLLKDTTFLASIDPEKYLDVLERESRMRGGTIGVSFSSRATTNFMKRCPNRILEKFELYSRSLHLPTFIKHLKKKEDIQTFLLKHAQNEKMKWFFSYKHMEPFIKQMSKETKFEFVKKIFIDKEPFKSQEDDVQDCELDFHRMTMKCRMSNSQNVGCNQNTYQWYKFAPFDIAFTDLKKLIRTESSPPIRNLMLQVLISCAGRNMTHIRTVLKYYQEKHINEPFKFKIQFVNTFLSKTDTHEFDNETWGLLNQLFQSMEVYVDSENSIPSCIKSIIIRHVIRGEMVPEIINTKFTFDTLKQYQNRLKKQEEKNAVFTYLYDYMVAKIDKQNITTQSELGDAIGLCEDLLNLLKDWKKDPKNYPFAIERVKKLLTVKQANSWNTAMASLYNINKSWKKVMFKESISLCPTEGVCINALKHDPGLLVRHKTEVEAMFRNDAILLTGPLSKVRIYWSESLAEEWKISYLNCLEKPGGHKALVIGLCTLLPQKQLNEVAKKYVPSESKISWNEINELVLSIQKQIAKNISKARPLSSPETVLWYAKGDYLQYAVPSLNSILSQLSTSKIRKYIPILLDAPVSLQKFGVRYAFSKLNSQELKPIITEIWNSTKNSSIRTVLFTHAHALLCKEKNTAHVDDIWEILSTFIDNLSSEENKLIYKKLGEVSGLPLSIQSKFFMKSYKFLKALPAKANCESIISNMEYQSPEIMEYLDDDFVVNMLKNIDDKFTKNHNDMYYSGKMVASFMLTCKDEEAATQRYERFLVPLLDRNLPLWNEVYDGQYHVKINLTEILIKLLYYIDDYNLAKKMNIPVKTFQNVQSKLEAALSPQRDYVFLTSWKLAVEFIKLVDEHKEALTESSLEEMNESQSNDVQNKYAELHMKIAPQFAKYCVQLLKGDLDRLYPSVYTLFSCGLEDFFSSFLSYNILQSADTMEYLKCILQCSNEKEVYLLVYSVLPRYIENLYSDKEKEKLKAIRQILFSHPSDELKIHYYQLYREKADLDAEK